MSKISQNAKIEKIKKLTAFFSSQNKNVFTTDELKELRKELQTYTDFFTSNNILKYVCLDFPDRGYKRFIFEEPDIYELCMTLSPKCYFSHYTAVSIHNLTDNIPKVIYVNNEQFPKNRQEQELKQIDITKAFYKKPRTTTNIAKYNDYRIYYLNGQFTSNIGVEEKTLLDGVNIRVANLERTLIDIAVSPHYSGGVVEVLKAYKSAKGKVSAEKLAEILKKINFKYPYHQVIGFYMERAGYSEKEYNIFLDFGIKYKFFVVREIDDKYRDFDKKWNLFFPKFI